MLICLTSPIYKFSEAKFNKFLFECEYQTQHKQHLFLSTNENKQNKYQFQRLL